MLFGDSGIQIPVYPLVVADSCRLAESAGVCRYRIRFKDPVRHIDRHEISQHLASPEFLGRPESELIPSVELLGNLFLCQRERDYRVGRHSAVGILSRQYHSRTAVRAHAGHLVGIVEHLRAAALTGYEPSCNAPVIVGAPQSCRKVEIAYRSAFLRPVKTSNRSAEIAYQTVAGNIVSECSSAAAAFHIGALLIPCNVCHQDKL